MNIDIFSNICTYLKYTDIISLFNTNKQFNSYNIDELYRNIMLNILKDFRVLTSCTINFKILYIELIHNMKLNIISYGELKARELQSVLNRGVSNIIPDLILFYMSSRYVAARIVSSSILHLIKKICANPIEVDKIFECLKCFDSELTRKQHYFNLVIELIRIDRTDFLSRINIDKDIIDHDKYIIKLLINKKHFKKYEDLSRIKYPFDWLLLYQLEDNINLFKYYVNNAYQKFSADEYILNLIKTRKYKLLDIMISSGKVNIKNINKFLRQIIVADNYKLFKLLYNNGYINTINDRLMKKLILKDEFKNFFEFEKRLEE